MCSFLYFQLLINCTSGGVYVNSCKIYTLILENSVYDGIIFDIGK